MPGAVDPATFYATVLDAVEPDAGRFYSTRWRFRIVDMGLTLSELSTGQRGPASKAARILRALNGGTLPEDADPSQFVGALCSTRWERKPTGWYGLADIRRSEPVG